MKEVTVRLDGLDARAIGNSRWNRHNYPKHWRVFMGFMVAIALLIIPALSNLDYGTHKEYSHGDYSLSVYDSHAVLNVPMPSSWTPWSEIGSTMNLDRVSDDQPLYTGAGDVTMLVFGSLFLLGSFVYFMALMYDAYKWRKRYELSLLKDNTLPSEWDSEI